MTITFIKLDHVLGIVAIVIWYHVMHSSQSVPLNPICTLTNLSTRLLTYKVKVILADYFCVHVKVVRNIS